MRHASKFVFVLAGLISWNPVTGNDWTEFRGPTGQGLSSATGLPLRWSATENVAWRTEIPGKGWSSPIVHQGRVYLTTAIPLETRDGAPQSLRTLCLSADSGAVVWNVEVFQQPAGVQIHGKNSHASPTPITDGKRLFVHFGTYGTAALDFDGKVLWKNRELKYDPRHGNGGSPALVDDLLVVSCDGYDVQFVVALDQTSGAIRWKQPRATRPEKGFSFGTPLVIEVGGRKQLISAGSDAVFAYRPHDGKEIWHVNYTGGYSVVPRPVYGEGLLFVCTGFNTPVLLAIRPEDAVGDATATHVSWTVTKSVPNNPSPLLVRDRLYLVSDNGVATCLDVRTGKQRWQHRVGGNFSASPLYADGKVYLQDEAGEGIVLEEGPGKYRELSRNSLGERTLASYAVGGRSLYVRSESHLYRVQAK